MTAENLGSVLGWTPKTEIEIIEGRSLRKLVGYFGGGGTEPTINVGKYEGDGGWVSDPLQAIDFVEEVSTAAIVYLDNIKADRSDIFTPIPLTFSSLTTPTTYTNVRYANQPVLIEYKNPTTQAFANASFNSSGVLTLPFTAVVGFVGTLIGTTGELANSIQKSQLFDITVGKNKFNKNTVTSGFYINTATGALIANGPSKMSAWIPIDPSKVYYVSGRNTGGLRLRTATGTIKPSNNANGTPRSDYGTAPSGGNAGLVYPPSDCIEFQMTVSLGGSDNLDLIQFEEGITPTAVAPYVESYLVKPAFVPILPYVTSDVLNTALGLKVDKSTILYDQVGKNKFDKTKIISGVYINTANGQLANSSTSAVSPWIPINNTVPYYIQGRTTGGVRFRDSIGNILPNNNANGTPRSDWSTSPNGGNDGVLYPPTGAIEVQFTSILSSGGNIHIQQLEEGIFPTIYEPYISTTLVKPSVLPTSTSVVPLFKVIKNNTSNIIRTYFDGTYDIRLNVTTAEYNGLFNISRADLLSKNDNDAVLGITLNGAGSDDSAPIFFNSQIFGGDHAGPSYKLTANAHGKILADVGGIYTDANLHRYIIFKIDDTNNLTVVVENTSVSSSTWTFPAPVGPLTYTSNGNSGTPITFTASVLMQLYPSIKNVVKKMVLDDRECSTNGVYYGNKLYFLESYDIVDYVDFVTKLISLRPIGGYLSQPPTTNGDVVLTITNLFEVQPKGVIVLKNTFIDHKPIGLNYFGITQNAFSAPTWATSVKKLIPKVLPINNNGNIFDFRLAPDFKTPVVTGEILITAAYWESGKVTSRTVDLLEGTGLKVNFNMGYLPIGNDRQNMVNVAWRITSNKKSYPRFIDDKINVGGLLPVNTIKQGIVFRGWSIPDGIRTNDILIECGGKYYLNLDYHTTGIDTYYLPSYLDGKNVTVIDKSPNVDLLTPLVSGCIVVKISSSSPMYGYIELVIF